MVLLKSLPLIILGFVSVVIALLVLQRGYRRKVNVAFSLLALGVGGWVLGIAAYLLTTDTGVALGWARFYYFFPLVIGAAMVMMAHLFPDKKTVNRRLFATVAGGFLLLAIPLIIDPRFLTEDIVVRSWGNEVILNRSVYVLYSLFICATFLEAMRVFYLNTKRLRGLYKEQARLVFFGLSVSAFFGVVFNLFLPAIGNYQLIHLGPLATNFFLIAIALSIIRHRMFDIRLIIVRSSAYLLALGMLVTGYVLLSYGLSQTIAADNSSIELLVNIAMLVFIALTYGSIKRVFDRVTNRYFYQDAYDPQQLIDELNKTIVSTVDVAQMANKATETISRFIKSRSTSLMIKETAYASDRFITIGDGFDSKALQNIDALSIKLGRQIVVADELEGEPKLLELMRKHDIAIFIRLLKSIEYDNIGVGYLVLSTKRSGNPYNPQDVKVIGIIANELVVALENGLRYEEIENFNATLQQKVDDATRKLQRANEKLKALDETKDEFISMASHQLRTPLTSVKGYVSMVLEGDAGKLNPMQTKLLEQSFASSQRMVYLIADLLNLSRLRTGKFIIENKPTNLADVIESELEQLKASAAGRNLTLTYDKPKDFPTLMMDETKIRQVIMNFSDNAIYYTPSGGKIDIKLKEDKSSIEFTVNDNGIGIPPAEQHKLFSKFFRAKNAQKARPDGTGLGLFMAKKVIVAQGGALVFKSTEGKGSTFGFSFSKHKLRLPHTKDS